MKFLIRNLVIFLVMSIPFILLDVNTVSGWHVDAEAVFPIYIYLANELLFIVIALELSIIAFFAQRKGWVFLERALLFSGGLLFIMVVLDLLVIFFSCTSSGPGGKLSISHMNWYRRYVKKK